MGQAKNRGNREKRIAEAQGLREMSLENVKKEYGLAEDATFLGYAVHLLETDEFLADFIETPAMLRKAWAKTPELAKTYKRFDLAYDDSRKSRGSIVVGMFDTGTQIFVATITDKAS